MLNQKNIMFSGSKLQDEDLPRIGHMIGVGEDILHAVIDVETGNKWIDVKGRLPMLYEPHVAYRAARTAAIRTKLVAAGLAYQKWKPGAYPKDSYPRFWKAYAIDPETACRACSWGGPQILGEEFKKAGYKSAEAMVLAFLDSQAAQIQGMVNFIKAKKLDVPLRAMQDKIDKGIKVTAEDARPFVKGYNGSGYEKNKYHTKFAASLNKWLKIKDTPWVPSHMGTKKNLYDGKVYEEIKAVQTILDEVGYPEVGSIDGRWGSRTAAAILAFRLDNRLQTTDPKIDQEFLAVLALKPKRPVSEARRTTTLGDLRKEDASVKQVDQTNNMGKVLVGVGGAMGAKEAVDGAVETGNSIKTLIDLFDPIQAFIVDNIWLFAVGVGAFLVWKSGIINRIRLEKHRTGQDVSV